MDYKLTKEDYKRFGKNALKGLQQKASPKRDIRHLEDDENTKNPKKDKKKFIIWSNEGHIDFEGNPSENISKDEYYLEFDDENEAKEWVEEQKKIYNNAWSDSLKVEDGSWRYED